MADRDELNRLIEACKAELMRSRITSLPMKIHLGEQLGLNLEGMDAWMRKTRNEFEAAVAAVSESAPIQPVATQEDAGKVQASGFTGDAIAKAWYATGQDIRGGSLHSFMDSLTASQPSNAVKTQGWNYPNLSSHTGAVEDINTLLIPMQDWHDVCQRIADVEAATVPPVVQAPNSFNVQSADFAGLQTAIKIIKSIDDGEAPEYMACIEAIQAQITTASNAGNAAQGAK